MRPLKSMSILKRHDLPELEVEKRVEEVMGPPGTPLPPEYELSIRSFETDTILKGRIVNVVNDEVVVDVGYKSEGIISISEFEDPTAIDIGDTVEVLLESVEDESGRSEEHTSELQSQSNLVCRLLLEKKKKKKNKI